ncbi:MAG: ATP-binding protein [Verrucomicrobiales bacterium]|nr:ATP-binding protein [Verrucomicrobiales bacterium]
MKLSLWQFLKDSLGPPAHRLAAAERARRVLAMQRNIVMPVKAVAVAVAAYYLFYREWPDIDMSTPRGVALETAQNLIGYYVLLVALLAAPMFTVRPFPPALVQWFVFTMGLLDGAFLAILTLFTGGFQSTLFWCFAGLIFVNALSIPAATPQIALNLLLSGFYMAAGLLDMTLETEFSLPSMPPRKILRSADAEAAAAGTAPNSTNRPQTVVVILSYPETNVPDKPAEPVLLRLTILWLLTVCGYGLQLLFEKQRIAQAEQQELSLRRAELKSAGRLAAEVAHQLKNPLAIINNAVYSLRKAFAGGKPEVEKQLDIIEEEIERADRILTELVGYAELSDGHIEKLNVVEEIDRAIEQVFPRNADWPIKVHRSYEPDLPPLWMVRRHFNEVLVNLLQNAREAMPAGGNVFVSARLQGEDSIEIRVTDEGPGIPSDKLEKVFDPYYTTKPKGSGLGLAIVKHNVELYDGTVRAESGAGKGATFVVTLPVRAAHRTSP